MGYFTQRHWEPVLQAFEWKLLDHVNLIGDMKETQGFYKPFQKEMYMYALRKKFICLLLKTLLMSFRVLVSFGEISGEGI